MLKPVDPGPQPPERPIGELVHELIENGKTYARAEIDLYKAIVAAKAKALVVPPALVAGAFICALAAVTALALGVVIALETFIGPLAAGFVGMLVFAAIAGLLGWYGYNRLRRDLGGIMPRSVLPGPRSTALERASWRPRMSSRNG